MGRCLPAALLGQGGLRSLLEFPRGEQGWGLGADPGVAAAGTRLAGSGRSGADASLERIRSAWPWRRDAASLHVLRGGADLSWQNKGEAIAWAHSKPTPPSSPEQLSSHFSPGP